MAIKRRILTRTTTGPADFVVCAHDEAINEKASDLKQYEATLELRHLVAKAGETFTEFHIHALSRPEMRAADLVAMAEGTRKDGRLSDNAYIVSKWGEVFRRGCTAVKNIERADGSRGEESGIEALGWLPDEYVWDIAKHIIKISKFETSEPAQDVGK